MDFFAPLFNFLTDNTKKLSSRAITVMVVIAIVISIDNISGFTYYYNLEKKLTIVTQLDASIKDSSISKEEKLEFGKLRLEVMKHKSLKDKLWDFLKNPNITWNSLTQDKESDFLYYLNILTASPMQISIMITGIIITIPQVITRKPRKVLEQSKFEIFLRLLGIEFLLYLLAIVEAKVLLSIPIIFNHIYYNYILNLLINFVALMIFYYFYQYLPEQKLKKSKAANHGKP